MGVTEDIFEVFFEKLKDDDSFPDATLEQLKGLYASNSLNSKDKIIAAIEKGYEVGSED